MQPIRQIYQDTPSIIYISIPEELQHHPVEVIIRALDDSTNSEIKETDANGWPIGFFERTFGSIPDLPEREFQGEYEERDSLE